MKRKKYLLICAIFVLGFLTNLATLKMSFGPDDALAVPPNCAEQYVDCMESGDYSADFCWGGWCYCSGTAGDSDKGC